MRQARVWLLFTALLLLVAGCSPPTESKPDPPKHVGFYWGTATAGYQVEGDAPDSNWRRYVDQLAGQPELKTPMSSLPMDPYRNAVDFRHRYREDISNAHAMGVNTFRIGVEWARVTPQPGEWDERELAYYDDVVAAIKASGMTPMVPTGDSPRQVLDHRPRRELHTA